MDGVYRVFGFPTVLALFLLAGMLTGCGESNSSSPEARTNSRDDKPAAGSDSKRDTAPPDRIVSDLLEALKRGDREAAESLISPIAREEMPKYQLKVEPPGTPDGQFKITEVEYPKDKPNTAYVGSIWYEPAPEGKFDEVEAVWIVKRQDDGQWRVSGVALEGPNKELVVLNFEKPPEMIKEWERLEAAYAQQQAVPAGGRQTPPAASTAQQPSGRGVMR